MIFLPPSNIAYRNREKKSIFLAGSIEMGKAEDWQTYIGNILVEKDFNVFNPRRTDWDSTWTQSYKDPKFSQQVHWEMNALKLSDYIILYLDPKTTSPVSLIEFGLHAGGGKLLMVCPDGFYRKGNIEVVCSLYDIPLYDTLDQLLTNNIFR